MIKLLVPFAALFAFLLAMPIGNAQWYWCGSTCGGGGCSSSQVECWDDWDTWCESRDSCGFQGCAGTDISCGVSSCMNCNSYDSANWDYSCVNNACQGTYIGCTDGCSPSGSTQCSGSYAQTCGNYDADSCLEWSSGTYCTYGCSGGSCNAAPSCTIQAFCKSNAVWLRWSDCIEEYVYSCGTKDCDTLDTTCRNYNDVSTTCSGGECVGTCNSYTNAPATTSCGTKSCASGASGSCTKYCSGSGSCNDCTLSCTETACSDGVDNDGDTKTDCADSDCSSASNCVKPTCSAPTIPSESSYRCQSVGSNKISFGWNAVTSASSYKIEWCPSTASFGSASCSSGTQTTGALYTATGLSASTTYNFRVRVETSDGTCTAPSGWSSTGSCTTASSAPSAPSSPSPSNGATGVSTTPTLSWSNVVSSGGWYYVYYKKSTDTAYTVSSQLTTNSYSLSGLSLGTTYNWNVRACNLGSTCTDSATWSFTTAACAGTISLSISPNPANPGSTVSLTASGLSSCDGKTVTFYAPVTYAYKLCPGATGPPNAENSCIVYTCTSSGSGCSRTFVPENEGGPVPSSYTFTAIVDKNGDGDTLDSGETASRSLSINLGSCTATQPSSGIVTLGNGCLVTLNLLGYDNTDKSYGRYSSTKTISDTIRFGATTVPSTGIYTEFDDETSGGCDLDLGFSEEWAVHDVSNIFIESRKSSKDASHFLSYGYSATTGGVCKFLDYTPLCKRSDNYNYCKYTTNGLGTSSISFLLVDSISFHFTDYIVGECFPTSATTTDNCPTKYDTRYKCGGTTNLCYQAIQCDKNDKVDGTSSQCTSSKSFCALSDINSQYYKNCVECLPGDAVKGDSYCASKNGVGYTCDAITYSCAPPKACSLNKDCDPGFCCTGDPTLPQSLRTLPGKCDAKVGTLKQPYLCTS